MTSAASEIPTPQRWSVRNGARCVRSPDTRSYRLAETLRIDVPVNAALHVAQGTKYRPLRGNGIERTTGVEPATSTLGRSRSAN